MKLIENRTVRGLGLFLDNNQIREKALQGSGLLQGSRGIAQKRQDLPVLFELIIITFNVYLTHQIGVIPTSEDTQTWMLIGNLSAGGYNNGLTLWEVAN